MDRLSAELLECLESVPGAVLAPFDAWGPWLAGRPQARARAWYPALLDLRRADSRRARPLLDSLRAELEGGRYDALVWSSDALPRELLASWREVLAAGGRRVFVPVEGGR